MNWINVKDRLPPNDVYVLVNIYDGRPKVSMNMIHIAARWDHIWIDDHNGDHYNPKYGTITHWMPLPDKPEKNNE